MKRRGKGVVYIVGAGPGDLELVTLRGLNLLGSADLVVCDRSIDPRLLDFAPNARRRFIGGRTLKQSAIHRHLVREARAGRAVVRLKIGDPMIFGRGGEEAAALARAGVPFEIVPGVTSAAGAAAYAGIPLTPWGAVSQVTFVTAHPQEDFEKAELPRQGTLVIFMAARSVGRVVRKLLRGGWKKGTPVAAVERATTARQRVVRGTLGTFARKAAGLAEPSIIIVGCGVAFERHLGWFRKKPLFGKRIVVTRAGDRPDELARRLSDLGAHVIPFPVIRIRPVRTAPIRPRGYTHVAFTSRTAVELFFKNLDGDARTLAGMTVCAVGEATARALRERGVRSDVVADRFTVQSLAKKLAGKGVRGARLLHPGADRMNPEFRKVLRARGAKVTDLILYRIESAAPGGAEAVRGADWITFASSQTVRNFAAAMGKPPKGARIACIGPLTARTARRCGFKVSAVPKTYTFEAMVKEIVRRS